MVLIIIPFHFIHHHIFFDRPIGELKPSIHQIYRTFNPFDSRCVNQRTLQAGINELYALGWVALGWTIIIKIDL